jgi:acetyl esterase/lipase
VHLVAGGEDPLVRDGRSLASALAVAGVEHHVLELPHGGHRVAITGEGPQAQEARRSQIAAVRSALGIGAPAAH